LIATFSTGLVACNTVGPDYVAPETETPDAWHIDIADGVMDGEASLHTWWLALNDPVLNQLMDRARAGNLDIQLAASRIDQARESIGIVRGEEMPNLGLDGSATRARASESTSPIPAFVSTTNRFALGLSAGWELDVWGRIRRSVESVEAQYGASIEDYRDVLVLMYAEVANRYIEIRAFQERVRYAEENLTAQRETLGLTRARLEAGLVPELDVRQAEQNLARTESSIPRFRAAIHERLNILSLLLGGYPGLADVVLEESQPIPSDPGLPALGLPADLLRQRADIRAAERRLAGQTARIGVATADLYPRFSLVGGVGLESLELNDLFDGNSYFANIGAPVDWQLFTGGSIRSNIAVEEARTEEVLIAYRRSVLAAVEEVESAMAAYIEEKHRREVLLRSVEAASKATELVRFLYISGLTDFQNVLDMERTLTLEQDALAETDGLVVQYLVRIYTALGGGWDEDTDPDLTPEEEESTS
jgi:NodT family efflux transporter outer membrane factor (OMF) lipoprotein